MIMPKTIVGDKAKRVLRPLFMAIVVILATIPMACMTDSDKRPAAPLWQSGKNLQTIDREQGFFTAWNDHWDCSASPSANHPFLDTTYYRIENDTLWTWASNSCFAQGYSGQAKDVIGHWEARGEWPRRLAPGALPFCAEPEPVSTPAYTDIQNPIYTLDISSKQSLASTFGTYCGAEIMLHLLLGAGQGDSALSGYELISQNCLSASARRLRDQEVAHFTSRVRNDTLIITAKFLGKTCAQTTTLNNGAFANPCDAIASGRSEAERFYRCVDAMGMVESGAEATSFSVGLSALPISGPIASESSL